MTEKFGANNKALGTSKLNMTAGAGKKTEGEDLSSRIEQYLDKHSVQVKLNTVYMLDAWTMGQDFGNEYMVLVMDAVNAKGTHITYRDYINGNQTPSMTRYSGDDIVALEEGRHFDYCIREK